VRRCREADFLPHGKCTKCPLISSHKRFCKILQKRSMCWTELGGGTVQSRDVITNASSPAGERGRGREAQRPERPPEGRKGRPKWPLALALAALALWGAYRFAPPNVDAAKLGVTAPGGRVAANDTLSFPGAKFARDVEFDTRGRGANSVLVWDWADEDGDVVKVAGREIELRNTPTVLSLPLEPGTVVEVLGVKDGRGGITVGVSVPGADPAVNIMALRPGQTGHIKIR